MSDGYRSGAFALGLVVGGGISLNLFLWLDYRTQNPSDQRAQADNAAGYSEVGNWWDRLIGTFVSPSDTLAQWIMAAFTIVAVLLVWRTLIATQQMARDTQRIGEAQVRAYLEIESAKYLGEDGNPPEFGVDDGVKAEIVIKNFGQTPAKRIRFKRHEKSVGLNALKIFKDGLDDRPFMEEFTLGAGAAFAYKIDNVVPPDTHAHMLSGGVFSIFAGEMRYLDVFGVEHKTVYNLRVENFGTNRVRIFPYYGKRNYSD